MSFEIFTVGRLNSTVRLILEQKIGQVWVNGEISNFTQSDSGHWYFTLKDDATQVCCVMFRSSNRQATIRPHRGQQVFVLANISLYETRGSYQIIVESIQYIGKGLLQQQYEKLKSKLTTEGIFNEHLKQPLPSSTRCVGVITSKNGAALHDILHILKRRDPSILVIIYPTAVQGNEAPVQIVRAIELANMRRECDVLVVGRGGGSPEDLRSFNDERVARAIFASQIPIVSAVGHETDITIADFVADLRAPTPSAAAEIISRNRQELLCRILNTKKHLERAMSCFLADHSRLFDQLYHCIKQQHPKLRLIYQQTLLTKMNQRINTALNNHIKKTTQYQQLVIQHLDQQSPQLHIWCMKTHIQYLKHQMSINIRERINEIRGVFVKTLTHLEAVNPLSTLARGYTITTKSDDNFLIRQIKQVKEGDILVTRLLDGWIESEVRNIKVDTSL